MRPSRGMVMMKEKARALATEHYKAHAPGTRSYFRLASEGNDAAGSVDRPAAESDYAAVILSAVDAPRSGRQRSRRILQPPQPRRDLVRRHACRRQGSFDCSGMTCEDEMAKFEASVSAPNTRSSIHATTPAASPLAAVGTQPSPA